MPADRDAALDQLISRYAITDLLHRYARLIDEQNFDAVTELFTEDCRAEYGTREGDTLNSSTEVVDWIRTQLRGVGATSHHISNVEVQFIDSDHAETVCYVYAWHAVEGAAVRPTVLGRYVDRLERSGGDWRIAHRQMFAHGMEQFPEGILRPLPLASNAEIGWD